MGGLWVPYGLWSKAISTSIDFYGDNQDAMAPMQVDARSQRVFINEQHDTTGGFYWSYKWSYTIPYRRPTSPFKFLDNYISEW